MPQTGIPRPKWPPAEKATPRRHEPVFRPSTDVKKRQSLIEEKMGTVCPEMEPREVEIRPEYITIPDSSSVESLESSPTVSRSSSPAQEGVDFATPAPQPLAEDYSSETLESDNPESLGNEATRGVDLFERYSRQPIALQSTYYDIPTTKPHQPTVSDGSSSPQFPVSPSIENRPQRLHEQVSLFHDTDLDDLYTQLRTVHANSKKSKSKSKSKSGKSEGYTINEIFGYDTQIPETQKRGKKKKKGIWGKLKRYIWYMVFICAVVYGLERAALSQRYCNSFESCAEEIADRAMLIRFTRRGGVIGSTGPIISQPVVYKWSMPVGIGFPVSMIRKVLRSLTPVESIKNTLAAVGFGVLARRVEKSAWEKVRDGEFGMGDLRDLVMGRRRVVRPLTIGERIAGWFGSPAGVGRKAKGKR
ncbi:hypothetical protein ABW19_dt0203909 [Dactylella cylindrospora]|nr:hypothetical protein ABW19_dt0203909 [Dactylella cylindrospora]